MIMETKMGENPRSTRGTPEDAFNALNLYSRYKLDQDNGNVVEVRRATSAVEYTHYNETTGVPLTSDAAAAHVATGQTVMTLEESYGKRLGRLSSMAAQNLAPRREQLSQLRHLILQRSDEIKEVR